MIWSGNALICDKGKLLVSRSLEFVGLYPTLGESTACQYVCGSDASQANDSGQFTMKAPLTNSDGGVKTSPDFTERPESEVKYRGLLEAAPDAMVVVGQGGQIVLLNLQAEKQFGYPAQLSAPCKLLHHQACEPRRVPHGR
jgi:PAS domain-containing protein